VAAESKVSPQPCKDMPALTHIQKSGANSSAIQGKGDVVARTTMNSSHIFPQAGSVVLPLRPLPVTSSLLWSAPSIANHSSEWDEQENYNDEEHSAFNLAMDLPIFNARATGITKLLGAYDPLNDENDDEECFGEPLEDFHSDFYKLAGLDANGEEISNTESVDSSGDEFDSDEEEFDSDENDDSDYSEYGDEELDRAFLIGDDEEKEEWEEHEHSDADLDAEEGVSASDDELEDDEETELEREGERKGSVSHD
jgi:hypothetical protein